MLEAALSYRIVNNEVWRLLIFFAAVLLSLVIGKLVRISLSQRADKENATRGWLSVLLRALRRPAMLISVAFAFWLIQNSETLILPAAALHIFDLICQVLRALAIGFTFYSLTAIVDYALLQLASRTETKVDDLLVPLVGKSIRVVILILVVAQILNDITEKPLTSVLAGLGVGGLAVALAAQDTIRNFFGSLVIVGDKPFEIGDRIVIDGNDGAVESVGFRSAKVRTLDGHLVTIPNSEMINKPVRNISARPYIKRVANITVTYDTSPEKLRKAVEIIKDILRDHEGMDSEYPSRVYFSDFNDWALNILVIYWYHPAQYWDYLAFSEGVNFAILERFNAEGIEFAFPSQSLYLHKEDNESI
jgi:MscS family membrane protein